MWGLKFCLLNLNLFKAYIIIFFMLSFALIKKSHQFILFWNLFMNLKWNLVFLMVKVTISDYKQNKDTKMVYLNLKWPSLYVDSFVVVAELISFPFMKGKFLISNILIRTVSTTVFKVNFRSSSWRFFNE